MSIVFKTSDENFCNKEFSIHHSFYSIIMMDGNYTFSVDFNKFNIKGKHILFMTPYQAFHCKAEGGASINILSFSGDFYCIEYHKTEVACNGILFNNIYDRPYITIDNMFFEEIRSLFNKAAKIDNIVLNYDLSIARCYLQLILALCSKEKQNENQHIKILYSKSDIINFREMLDAHITTSKSVSFYAELCGISVNAFSKKVKKHYGKIPSKLIQERLTLEAKKLLHLTYKSIKQISSELGFEDEFYFSRYFKKEVGVSPKIFRQEVGISIVAKKSM